MSRLTIFVFLVFWAACQQSPSPPQPTPDPPPYQVADTVTVAQMFSEGIVSSALPEFATTFSPDGHTVYFNRMPADRSAIRIWTSSFVDGQWTEPEALPFSDGTYRDVDPFVSPDGQRLYFSSTRPIEGTEPAAYDLWYVERSDTGWRDPVNLGIPVNSDQDEIYATLSTNGTLYFSVFEAEGDGVGLYRAVWEKGAFQAPERLVLGADTLRLTNPTIAPDESYLLLVSGHTGQADIYISRRLADGGWTDVEALGPAVNSPYTEFAPSVSPDGTTLFFTSERPGVVPEGAVEGRAPGDLYVVPVASALP